MLNLNTISSLLEDPLSALRHFLYKKRTWSSSLSPINIHFLDIISYIHNSYNSYTYIHIIFSDLMYLILLYIHFIFQIQAISFLLNTARWILRAAALTYIWKPWISLLMLPIDIQFKIAALEDLLSHSLQAICIFTPYLLSPLSMI